MPDGSLLWPFCTPDGSLNFTVLQNAGWVPVLVLLYIEWVPIAILLYGRWVPVMVLLYAVWVPVTVILYVGWVPATVLLYAGWVSIIIMLCPRGSGDHKRSADINFCGFRCCSVTSKAGSNPNPSRTGLQGDVNLAKHNLPRTMAPGRHPGRLKIIPGMPAYLCRALVAPKHRAWKRKAPPGRLKPGQDGDTWPLTPGAGVKPCLSLPTRAPAP